jgi:hypothetical protein
MRRDDASWPAIRESTVSRHSRRLCRDVGPRARAVWAPRDRIAEPVHRGLRESARCRNRRWTGSLRAREELAADDVRALLPGRRSAHPRVRQDGVDEQQLRHGQAARRSCPVQTRGHAALPLGITGAQRLHHYDDYFDALADRGEDAADYASTSRRSSSGCSHPRLRDRVEQAFDDNTVAEIAHSAGLAKHIARRRTGGQAMLQDFLGLQAGVDAACTVLRGRRARVWRLRHSAPGWSRRTSVYGRNLFFA